MEEIKTILAIGDSNTYGAGVERNETYPAQLELNLRSNGYNHKIINSGINGNTSRDGVQRLQNELLHHQPDIVILLFGVADLRRGYTIKEIYDNFSTMIELCKTSRASVIIVGYTNPKSNEQKEILSNIATKGKVTLSNEFFDLYSRLSNDHQVDRITDFLDGILGVDGTLQDDEYSHLTGKGYKIFVEKLYPVVVKNMKTRSCSTRSAFR